MTLVLGNMTLNVKIFSNLRPEEVEEKDTNSMEVVTEQGLDLICRKDPVEAALISPVTDSDYYTPQEWEVRQVCYVLEVVEEELVMGL